MRQLTVHLLPFNPAADFAGATAVVIDVLRASTTIVTALAHGADCIIPVADVAVARAIAQQEDNRGILLGGERGGEKIAGFDLDNSPSNYTRQIVAGKRVVFTTSHGTQAIAWSDSASQVLIASFLNMAAVVQQLVDLPGDLHLVCSGTDNHPSIEDSLCAATITGQIWERRGKPTWRDDTAGILLELYQTHTWADEAERRRLLTSGRGGQRLTELGFSRDIAYAAQLDTVNLVPQVDRSVEPAHIVPLSN